MRAALILAASALLAAPQLEAQTNVTGEWWTPGFNARVRIEPCGDAVCGRIVWLWDKAPKGVADKHPLVGRLVIDRMQAAEAGFWRGGRLYLAGFGRGLVSWPHASCHIDVMSSAYSEIDFRLPFFACLSSHDDSRRFQPGRCVAGHCLACLQRA